MNRPTALLLATTLIFTAAADPRNDPGRPVAKTDALSPAATAAQFKVPEGFHVEVVAGEPAIVQPIAYTIDDRGRLWVVENTNYPDCPGAAKDKIVVFESTKGDGKYDKRTVFWDKATFTSGIAVGFGGVWLGSPPNLIFIPVKDGELKPAGEPQFVLDGWGNEDTHETLNDFAWGPDGWLYGTQGIFTESHVGTPGTPDKERVAISGGVWRYHPTRKVFERWVEGVSNQWGLDWNDHGEAFFAACVVPHMWQAIGGGHYLRQAGADLNPHNYELIQTIAWGRYEKAAYCGAMIYLGGAFPGEWRDKFFFHDIHMNKTRCEQFVRVGSGFRSEKVADFLVSPDAWFRGLSPQYGPDGSVFFNDWYDRVPCHQQRAFTDRSNGRVYRLTHDAVKPVAVDLTKASSEALVTLQLDKNDWLVRHARRLLQERGPKPETTRMLEDILNHNTDDTRQLRALWTLHSQRALTESTALGALADRSEHVRGWTATVVCEEGKPSAALLKKLIDMAKSDPSPLVRLRLASAAQRIPVADRWPMLEELVAHEEDAKDMNLPLMNWYAAEPAVAADPIHGIALFSDANIPKLHEFIARRITALSIEDAAKASAAMDALSKTLATADSPVRRDALRGMLAALKGRKNLATPAAWDAAYAALQKDSDIQVRDDARKLALIFGSRAALDDLRAMLTDKNSTPENRRAAIEALAVQRDAASLDLLIALLATASPLRADALRALAAFDDARIAPAIVARFAELDPAEKSAALNTLTARPASARALLAAIDAGTIPKAAITAPLARVVQGFKDAQFNAWLEKNWGSLKSTSAEKQAEIARYKKFLSPDAILLADVNHGREIFRRTCAVCHTLFGTGGKIGPELPGSFADMDYLLTNILDPNAVIGKDYQMVFVTTKSGELQAGIPAGEDANSLTLKTLAAPVTIPLSEIKSREVSPNSMMPEGLLSGLQEPEIRDLFLYLRQSKEP